RRDPAHRRAGAPDRRGGALRLPLRRQALRLRQQAGLPDREHLFRLAVVRRRRGLRRWTWRSRVSAFPAARHGWGSLAAVWVCVVGVPSWFASVFLRPRFTQAAGASMSADA